MRREWTGPLVYVSSVDLTAPTGPSVNEREALLALRRLLGDDLVVIVGQSQAAHPDLLEIRPYRYLPWGQGNRARSMLTHQLNKARVLRRELRRLRPRCVVTRLDAMPLGLLLGTLGFPVRLVVKSLGGATMRLDPAAHGRLPVMAHRLLMRGVARKVTAADTITYQRRPLIAGGLRLPESRVAVIDNGVNVERFHLLPPAKARERCHIDPEAVVFGYAGTQGWVRGARHLIEAGGRLKAEFAHPLIMIVGGGDDIPRLQRLAKELGHDDICVFPGLVPFEDVVWWMNCFDVAISVEESAYARREGHAQQKVRQYTAAGVPVVSAFGGNEYLAEHGIGTLVDPDRPEEVAEALVRWARLGGSEREEFRQRAWSVAERSLTVEALNAARVEFWERMSCR